MKKYEVLNLLGHINALDMEKVDKKGKFEVLDIIDELQPEADKYRKQEEEAVKMITDRTELNERIIELQQREVDVEYKRLDKKTFEQIVDSNGKLTAGVLAVLRRYLLEKKEEAAG